MSGRFYAYYFTLFIVSFNILSGCNKNDNPQSSQETPTEFGRIIANRPAPDLETLAERSAPGYKGQDATEAFYDILKLRDIGDADAVPVLEKILSDHVNSTRIHGYAAAQALFCIGTLEAHQILSKYLLTDQYNVGLSINYIYHWEMDTSKYNAFIEQYLLQNLSKDMSIKLGVEKNSDEKGKKLDFTITLTNISKEPYRILDERAYIAQMLFFRSEYGRFARWYQPVMYGVPMPEWIELLPGDSYKYSVSVYIKKKGKQESPYFGKEDNINIVLETFDMLCGIEKAGEFKVYAMVEQQPLNKIQLEQLDFDNPWSGRAVSEPVIIDIDL